jgi:hypothetical protein
MTEYVIKEVGRPQWLVFANRQSIAVCADENEALKLVTEHSAARSRSHNSADDNLAEQNRRALKGEGQKCLRRWPGAEANHLE